MSTNIIHSTAVMLCMIAQIVLSAFAPWIRNPLIANAVKSAISNLFTILIFFAFTTYTSFLFLSADLLFSRYTSLPDNPLWILQVSYTTFAPFGKYFFCLPAVKKFCRSPFHIPHLPRSLWILYGIPGQLFSSQPILSMILR